MSKALNVKYSGTRPIKGEDGKPTGEKEQVQGEVIWNAPETLDEAIQQWGEGVVLSKALASIVIDIQRICRTASDANDAQELVDAFSPSISRERSTIGTSQKALIEALKAMSVYDPAKFAEFMSQYVKKAGTGEGAEEAGK